MPMPQMMQSIQSMRPRSARKRVLIGAAVLLVAGTAWYLFRPELLFVNKNVDEGFPAATAATPAPTSVGTKALASGRFHKAAHETKGTATIHELANGRRVLRLTGFETSNGPDVHVYLVAARDAMDSDTVKQAGYIDLGSLKGNIGDQNYDIPSGADLAKYQAVTIWCKRFGVNFGTAPLATK